MTVTTGNDSYVISASGKTTVSARTAATSFFFLRVSPDFAGYINSVSVKGMMVISYNYLNLPEKIFKGRTQNLTYVYDATGKKLSQTVVTPTATKQTDYAREFFYENDTIKFINHEEGRIVMTGAVPEYQYHLKDHLGNVRVTFTTKNEIDTLTATGELARREYDVNTFGSYSPTEDDLFDHTDAADTYKFAQLLHGGHNSQVAMTKSLSVMPGDTIKAEVYAKYREIPNPQAGLTGFAAALTSAFGLNAPIPGDPGTAYNTLDHYGTLIADGLDHSEDEAAPKAYLNILLFDRNHQFVDAAYSQIDISKKQVDLVIKADHDMLEISKFVTTPGYAYIFVSNENPTQVDVFFDDLKLEHVKSPVEQMDDYYPFGLTYNSYSRENSIKQNYLFSGKERQDELNLGWDDFGARMYMSDIGRWGVIDPLSDKMRRWSPYNYAFNNPLRYIDPDGMKPWLVAEKFKNFVRRIDSWFGPRNVKNDAQASKNHKGLDINFGGGRDDYGAPVQTTHDGKVTVKDNVDGKSGRSVWVESPDGTFRTAYFHLSDITVKEGDKVKEGQQIAEIGSSGRGSEEGVPSHLHYEIHKKNEETGAWEPMDPTEGKGKDEANIVDPQKWIKSEEQESTTGNDSWSWKGTIDSIFGVFQDLFTDPSKTDDDEN